MKAKTLSLALTIVSLLLAEEIDLKNSSENIATNTSRRILYGEPANVFDFSFMVALRIGSALCGGTIIANQWILTAGHCVYGNNCSMFQIDPAVWKFGESLKAAECYVHPNYSITDNDFTYDISLLKIAEDFLKDGRAKTISLPEPGTNFTKGTKAVIAGWGKTEESIFPNRLLRANLLVEDWNNCNEAFREYNVGCKLDENCTTPDIPIRTLCTQGESSNPGGSCFGDSGGPVLINDNIAGVVSFGLTNENGQCIIGLPSMHTSVVDYLPWIYSYIDPERDTSEMKVRPEV